MKVINSFSGEYRWLSNFTSNSNDFNVEREYQATKAIDLRDKSRILIASSPGEAKRIGNQIVCRSDWEEIKDQVMLDCVRRKFSDPNFAERLLATNGAELIEGNHWGDTYWGVCRGKGQNKLGKILMQVREEIRTQKENQ